MAKIAISSITNINFIDVAQAISLGDYFCISLPKDGNEHNMKVYQKLIADCPDIIAMSIDLKCQISDFLFCFDSGNNFICFHDSLQFSSHFLEVSLPLTLEKSTFAQLSFLDKVKVTAQLSMVDENGLLQLPWSFLCKEQMVSTADMFSIKLTSTQIQNCHNMANALSAKIRRSAHYRGQYGKSGSFVDICFDFSINDLFSCIGFGRDDAEVLIGKFCLPSTRQPKQKMDSRTTSNKSAKAHALSETPITPHQQTSKEVNCDSSIANQPCQPLRSPQADVTLTSLTTATVSSVQPLSGASLGQLKGITDFYSLKLELTRRTSKLSIMDLIKGCKDYSQHLLKSHILSDVIFCFDINDKVLCTFQDLMMIRYPIHVSKQIKQLYVSSLSSLSSLSYEETCCILLQKAMASISNNDFAVPWCALTFEQKVSVAEDYCDAVPCNVSSAYHKDLVLWDLVRNSAEFMKHYGTFQIQNLFFIGSVKSPKDISIQVSQHQSGTNVSNSDNVRLFFDNLKVEEPTPSIENRTAPMLASSNQANTEVAHVTNSLLGGAQQAEKDSNAHLQEHNHVLSSSTPIPSLNQEQDLPIDSNSCTTETINQCSATPTSKDLAPTFSIDIDDDFSLKFNTKQNLCNENVDPKNFVCKACKLNCKDEILCCGMCLLHFHYTCYPSEKCGNGSYKHMSARTYNCIKNISNLAWLCNDCDSASMLSSVLEVASVKVKEKVSQSINQINRDLDIMEEELGPDSELHKQENETSLLPEMYSTLDAEHFSGSMNSVAEIPLSTSTSTSSLYSHDLSLLESDHRQGNLSFQVAAIKEKQELNQVSKVQYTSSIKCTKTQSKSNPSVPKTTLENFLEKDEYTIIKSKQLQSQSEESLVELEKQKMGKNSVAVRDFTISWSSKEDQESFICDNVCKFCHQECTSESTVSCYICSLTLHSPCPSKAESIATSFDHESLEPHDTNSQHCLKWFCKSCESISFQQAVRLMGYKVLDKVSKRMRMEIKNELAANKEVLPHKAITHFPTFQKQLCSQIKDTMSSQFTSIKDDIIKVIKLQGNTSQSSSTQNPIYEHYHPVDQSPEQAKRASYSEKVDVNILPSINQRNLPKQDHKYPGKVDPTRSIIIKNVQSSKFRNSSNCKSQFNKHFERMRIKSIFSTQAGNIIVELFEKEDVKRVLKEWKPYFFCPAENSNSVSSDVNKATKVLLMESTGRPTEIIIKKVQKNLTELEITHEMKSVHNLYTDALVKRFVKRDGTVLNTIKVTFTTHDDYLKAIQLGVFIHGEHFNVEAFKQSLRAHQCYKCKNFGHPAKWCTRKVRCEYCSHEGHTGRECIIQGEVHQYHCSNCDGQHSATYHQCPTYIKHLRRPQSLHSLRHD